MNTEADTECKEFRMKQQQEAFQMLLSSHLVQLVWYQAVVEALIQLRKQDEKLLYINAAVQTLPLPPSSPLPAKSHVQVDPPDPILPRVRPPSPLPPITTPEPPAVEAGVAPSRWLSPGTEGPLSPPGMWRRFDNAADRHKPPPRTISMYPAPQSRTGSSELSTQGIVHFHPIDSTPLDLSILSWAVLRCSLVTGKIDMRLFL